MRTLTINEASSFLRLPTNELIARINAGQLPAAKMGDYFVFLDTDLVDYLRSQYQPSILLNSRTIPLKDTNKLPLFRDLVPHVLRLEENRVRRNELTQKTFSITKNKLSKFVMPYFGDLPINEVDYSSLSTFVEKLTDNEIKGVAISQYLIVIKKVLNYAHLTNVISSLPQFPKVKTPRTSRGAFTISEYRRLRKTAWRMREQPYKMLYRTKSLRVQGASGLEVHMPRDMARLIGFMVNSFIRPSDLKFIQHKHIEIIKGDYNYLKLSIPETKKHDQPIVTMSSAVGIYRRLLSEARLNGYGRPNDYLFMPELAKRRDHALRHMGFLFNWVLESCNLKYGLKGQTRTLYCLRHTAITYRLLYGEGVDLLTLAKNARTSVIMIERHYASTLNGEMNIGLLHSKRTRKSKQ